MRWLFASFLESEEEYRRCEAWWRELVERIARECGCGDDWKSWIPRASPDGTPVERDGNPIWDGRSVRSDRAFRVMQVAPSDEGGPYYYTAWVKTREPGYAVPAEELFLSLALSDESAVWAETLLRKWMQPGTTVPEIQRLIDDLP